MIRIIDTQTTMTKEKIVLLPGYDGHGQETFIKLAKLLSKQYTCLIIDYPYYRQTTKSYSVSELINYIHQQIKKRNNGKFHLLGFSMGGFLASAYATEFPENIKSLTLISSSVTPNLTGTYRALITLSYYAFKLPILAKLFGVVYCSPLLSGLVKHSPLPKPRDNFPLSEAYPLFGTLANVLYNCINSDTSTQIKYFNFKKDAILFKDDSSFPAATYTPILTNLGFRVIVKNTGGHAVGPDYWDKVFDSLYR